VSVNESFVCGAKSDDHGSVGALIAAGITLGTGEWNSTWAWRLPSLFQGIFSVLCILILPFMYDPSFDNRFYLVSLTDQKALSHHVGLFIKAFSKKRVSPLHRLIPTAMYPMLFQLLFIRRS
jgi:hypothetical protein